MQDWGNRPRSPRNDLAVTTGVRQETHQTAARPAPAAIPAARDGHPVYYDIEGDHVNVLGIVPKDRADEWLARYGERV